MPNKIKPNIFYNVFPSYDQLTWRRILVNSFTHAALSFIDNQDYNTYGMFLVGIAAFILFSLFVGVYLSNRWNTPRIGELPVNNRDKNQ